MKRSPLIHIVAAFICVCCMALMARAADAPAPTTAPSIPVALLDFDASMPGNADLGKQITEALTAVLTGESGFKLVDRAAMNRTLQEHELNLTGLVNPDQAAQVGKLVGAKILVTGKAFLLDKQVYVTAKIIGTETSLVEGILVKGPKDADTGALVIDLSQKLADRLRTSGPKLLALPDAPDPFIVLQDRLKNRQLPKLAILFVERHVSQPQEAKVDPAVESEFKTMLTQCGFTVIEGDEKDWTRENVDVMVTGEAFSEAATKIGNIVSCSGRVELKVINRKDGKLLMADRATARAADLSEQMAAKTALQKAAHGLGIKVLEYFDKQPASAPAKP